jgi:hypothetical protein
MVHASLDCRDVMLEALVSNVQQFSNEGIPFLGLQANLSNDHLCTPCTRNVMNIYTAQLNDVWHLVQCDPVRQARALRCY